ncbi:MAG TPA: four helix bundle protein [Thermoanaerobaculia bacterium]
MEVRTILPFADWVVARDGSRTGDPLWSVQAYRLASYAIACHYFDRQARPGLAKAANLDQLTRAIGSIAANIGEGYSRPSMPDQSRFYAYALGSTREAIDWYDVFRLEVGDAADDRQAILIQIRRLLLTMLRNAHSENDRAAMSRHASPKPARDN